MIRLSVNVNKIATLRNSRTAQTGSRARGLPSVVAAARVCVDAGAPGITVHPRPDARHITTADVRELATLLGPLRDRVEYNVEGDARDDLVALVEEVRPHQYTLVPVRPFEITSSAGWPADTPPQQLRAIIERMHAVGVRVSVFVDPEPAPVRWAAELGADRIELYTEPFAVAYAADDTADKSRARQAMQPYIEAATLAHQLGLGINAGHDLDIDNLTMFRALPHLAEVSIGHALVAQAMFDGLDATVRRYLAVLEGTRASSPVPR